MRPVLAVTTAAAVVALCGCGSQARPSPASLPSIPRAVADALAARSDALAATLEQGDDCGAIAQTHALERETRAAISSGRIPSAFRASLLAAVVRVAARIPRCTPPPPAKPEEHGNPKGKRKHKKKHGHGGEGGD